MIIYCDGGLGNRLNSLIGGIYLAEKLGSTYTVSWPINRWCGISFNEIFQSALKIDQRTIDDLNLITDKKLLIAHEKQTFNSKICINPNSYFFVDGLILDIKLNSGDFDDIIYFNNLVPLFVSSKEVLVAFSLFTINKYYIQRAEDFLTECNLENKKYWGLHLRGTDINMGTGYYKVWRRIASLLPGKVLLCTDDKRIEDMFSGDRSIVYRDKSAMPKKSMIEAGWNETCIDEYGRQFDFNISRDNESMRESIVDFYLLSKSILLPTSNSTFLSNAFRYGNNIYFFRVVHELRRFVRLAYKKSKKLFKLIKFEIKSCLS